MPLLRLHGGAKPDEPVGSVDDKVKVLAPVRALKGKGRFDVVEVWGHIYNGATSTRPTIACASSMPSSVVRAR